MSPRDLAFVGCRLLALYFVYVFWRSIPPAVYAISRILGLEEPQDLGEIAQLFYEGTLWQVLAHPLLGLAMVLVLWFGAERLSRKAAHSASDATTSWSPRPLLSVGVVLLGLVLVSFALPVALHDLLLLVNSTGEFWAVRTSSLVAEVVQVLIGFGLIVESERIAGTIARLRRT
jgi:hypothetical protein